MQRFSGTETHTPGLVASGRRPGAGENWPPRVLLLPPSQHRDRDPIEVALVRSLISDVTLTLCKSRHYEVFAPFTASQLALREPAATAPHVVAEYTVRSEFLPGTTSESYSTLAVDVLSRAGKPIYQNQIELRTGVFLNLHFALCAILTEQISGRIAQEEIVKYRRTGAASAYVHYLLAMQHSDRTDLASVLKAQRHLVRSVALSPDYVPALSQLARTKTLEWLERGSTDRSLLLEARHLADRAHFYEPSDSSALRERAHAALYLHDLETALEDLAAAETAAPNHADLLADQADVLTHASRADEAEQKISRALALNPLAPDDYYWVAGAVSFFRGRYQEALQRLQTMRSPGLAYRLMAACAAMNNDHDLAGEYRLKALERDPMFRVENWTSLYPQPNKKDTEHYLYALRRAGFP